MAVPAPAVVDLHHRIDGTGRRLVLLHPVGLDLTCFEPLLAALGAGYAVLRVDARGHGRSPMRPAAGLEDYAADVHAVLRRLQWTPAVIAGFSFGGMLAQTLALNYPADVENLVVGACASTLSDTARALMRERGDRAEREGMAAVIEETMARWWTPAFRAAGGDAAIRRRLLDDDVHAWAAAWRAIAGVDTAARLHEIEVPTLCLAGEQDVSAPPAVLEAIARRIAGARLEVIAGAPHMLFIEQPQAVAAAIARFAPPLPPIA